MISRAAPAGRASTSAAARCWNAVGYATTGGQALWSEATIAQPLDKIVMVARAISPDFQHMAQGIIGPFGGLKALGGAPGGLAAAAGAEDEEEDGGGEGEPRQDAPP